MKETATCKYDRNLAVERFSCLPTIAQLFAYFQETSAKDNCDYSLQNEHYQ